MIPSTDQRTNLHVELNARDCAIPEDELAHMQKRLQDVGDLVRDLPASQLRVNVIHHPRTQSYHVEAKLKVPGETLLSGDRNTYLDSAFQGCMDRLLTELKEYRDNPDRATVERAEARATLDRQIVMPADPDAGPIAAAAQEGDYKAFRTAMAGYEEWIRKRVGRWVQRHPEVEERIGGDILIGDLIEEVYLLAFENFTKRSTDIRLSEWLDKLLEPALAEAVKQPDVVRQEASMARTLRDS